MCLRIVNQSFIEYNNFMVSNVLKNTKLILISILVFACFVRVINIDNNPTAMYGDELTMVYDVYSISKTGFDQTGQFLPLTFKMGDNRPVGYGYFSLPFVVIFGPSSFAIRALSIISGVGIVWVIFLLGKKLFSKEVGFVAAGITAVSPWDIALSRGGFETHFALFLSLLGIYFFLQATQKPKFYILSAGMFALSMHTYSTFKLTAPLIILLLIWFVGFKKISANFKQHILTTVVAVLLLGIAVGLIGVQAVVLNSESRFTNLNVFSQHDLKNNIIAAINNDINTSSLPPGAARVFHNKPLEYMDILIKLYLRNFSIDFLFLDGDLNPRHNMALMGQLYLVEIITIFLGIIFLFKEKLTKIFVLLLLWIGLAAIPATLLMQTHALRSSLMLPPLVLLSAVGFLYLFQSQNLGMRILKFLVIIVFILQCLAFIERSFFVSPNQFSRFWSYPARLASEKAISGSKQFDYVILSDKIDNTEFAYPVYAKVDPNLVLSQNKQQVMLNGYKFRNYGNVYIGALPDTQIKYFMSNLNGTALFIGNIDEAKNIDGYELLNGKDGEKAIILIKK